MDFSTAISDSVVLVVNSITIMNFYKSEKAQSASSKEEL